MQLIERNLILRGDYVKIVQSYLTKNPCYTSGRKITVKGLMLHSVGCPQPNASVFINSWNSPSFGGACVHGFIDGNTGVIYQTLPWNHRGWHCASGRNGSGNNTHIGVEMCEPACIRYTGGSSFTCSDLATAKASAKRTYDAAVELFAMLCKTYKLNPLKDGVIISHKEGHARGIASNHGDPEHLWKGLGMGYTMDTFRKAVKVKMSSSSGSSDSSTVNYTKITGTAKATAKQMETYIKSKNPKVPKSVIDMIPLYLSEGKAEGIRGDIAFAQSCLETGNFTFKGSAVTIDQNNFCGMGVTATGMKGNSFKTPQLGIRAQIQHLKAYANTSNLKNKCVDPRFKYVERGCAKYVEWLGIQENPKRKGWAAGANYGTKILTILKGIIGKDSTEETKETWFRVRKSWADSESQKGAFKDLINAKKCADENYGYSVFNDAGKKVYTGKLGNAFKPYEVEVETTDLRIRTGPGTNYGWTGDYTGKGIFTIVEESSGAGSDKGWGKLKSGAGWISLDFAKKK